MFSSKTTSLSFLVTIGVSFLLHTSLTNATCSLKFHDCGSVKGKLSSAVFNGSCTAPGSGVADLKKGTVAGIKFTFTASEQESSLKSKVEGKVAGIWVPFPLDNPDACTGAALTCPVPANTAEVFSPALPIKSIYPAIHVEVKWQLQDPKGTDVFCALVLASISD